MHRKMNSMTARISMCKIDFKLFYISTQPKNLFSASYWGISSRFINLDFKSSALPPSQVSYWFYSEKYEIS